MREKRRDRRRRRDRRGEMEAERERKKRRGGDEWVEMVAEGEGQRDIEQRGSVSDLTVIGARVILKIT